MFDGLGHPGQLGDPGGQQLVPAPQVLPQVRRGVVEQGRDLVEREAELPVEQDLLQPVEVGVFVPPVARVAAAARGEQADLVVVVQRAHRDGCETGDLADRVTLRLLHDCFRAPFPTSLGPHVT
ncbi:hypothetical protein GCM10009612_72020 [Streptomyces beijiangensis]